MAAYFLSWLPSPGYMLVFNNLILIALNLADLRRRDWRRPRWSQRP